MFSWGVGWGGLITFMCTSTHTQARLRSCTFSCTSTHTSCYATVHSHSYAAVHSLTLPHTRHATLLYVLYFALPQAHVMLRHAAVRSLAIPHTHTHVIRYRPPTRYQIFSCTEKHPPTVNLYVDLSSSEMARHATHAWQSRAQCITSLSTTAKGTLKNQFFFWYKTLSVHTGTIDSIWTQMKESIPSSLSSKSPQISTRIRSFQWRFTHAENSNLLKACGHELSEAWQMGEKRKGATAHVWFVKTCGKTRISLKPIILFEGRQEMN